MLARLLGFLLSAVLARQLGVEDFGRWNYLQAILLYLVVLLEFGSNQEGIRSLIQCRSKGLSDFNNSFNYTIGARQSGYLLALLTLIILFMTNVVSPFEAIALSICATAYLLSKDWFLRATEKQFIATLQNTIPLGLLLTASILISYSPINIETSSTRIFILRGLFLFITIALTTWFFVSKPYKTPLANFRYMKPSSNLVYLVGGSLLAKAYFNSDIIIIDAYLNKHQLGLYSSVATIYAAFIAFRGVIINALYPTLCSIKEHALLTRTLNRYSLLFGICLLPFFIVSHYYRYELIELIFGSDYVTSITSELASVFIYTCIVLSFGLLYPNALHIRGKSKVFFSLTLIASLINIGGNLIYIPSHGILAAAYTTLAAETFIIILSFILVHINSNTLRKYPV
ncbi:Polysaccharide biosynthesis protein [compost metagenome]